LETNNKLKETIPRVQSCFTKSQNLQNAYQFIDFSKTKGVNENTKAIDATKSFRTFPMLPPSQNKGFFGGMKSHICQDLNNVSSIKSDSFFYKKFRSQVEIIRITCL